MFQTNQIIFFEEKYIAFRVDSYVLAFKMLDIKEIININSSDVRVFDFPDENNSNNKAVSVRGKIVALKKFKGVNKKPSNDSKLILLNCDDQDNGLIVDEVEDIISISNKDHLAQSVLRIKNEQLAIIVDCEDLN